MKLIPLSFIAFIFSICVNAQSLTIREIENAPVKEEPQLPKYDTLSNIQFQQPINNYKIYIGQDILFYPRSKQSTNDIYYYGNFKLLKPDTLYDCPPDTIWIKRRKNVKPGDFRLERPVSDLYKPKYIENQKVCFGNKPFWKLNEQIKSGYYTPYQEIEGKIFKILDCEIKPGIVSDIRYTLMDEDGKILIWEINALHDRDHAFPAIIVAYYEKIKNQYVGKSFFVSDYDMSYSSTGYYAQNIKRGEKYTKLPSRSEFKCTDLSLIGNKNEYLVPKLVFEDTLTIDITTAPTLSYLSGYDNAKGKKDYLYLNDITDDYHDNSRFMCVATLNSLISAESVYEKRRIAEEERLAQEKAYKEKQLAYEKSLKIQREQWEKRIFAKYKDREIADLIIKGRVRLGMTKEMCIDAWGSPSDINKSIGTWGTLEQWVYGIGSYLYFENGKLTSIQN